MKKDFNRSLYKKFLFHSSFSMNSHEVPEARTLYEQEINRKPLLTKADEQLLGKRKVYGSPKAQEQAKRILIERNTL